MRDRFRSPGSSTAAAPGRPLPSPRPPRVRPSRSTAPRRRRAGRRALGSGALAVLLACHLRQLTRNEVDDFIPRWSPDRTKLAYMSGRARRWQIHVVNADGSDPLALTRDDTSNHDPAWSPDGNWIAFMSRRDGSPDIHVMRADGSDRRVVVGD